MNILKTCHHWIYRLHIYVLLLLINFSFAANKTLCEWQYEKGEGQICYWMTEELKTFREAKNECQTNGGDIVVISNELENAVVLDIIKEKDITQVWIGLEEEISSWRWMRDNTEIRLQGCYLDSINSRDLPTRTIQIDATHESCVKYCKDQGFTYAGLQAETSCFCGNSFGKYGSLPFGPDGCSTLCPGDDDRRQTCGADLASTILSIQYGYDNWLYGQPNNHQGYQTCAAIEKEDSYRFNDIKCMERLGLICDIPFTNSSECSDAGYAVFNDSHCLYITNTSISWFTAKHLCHQIGGSLVEIRDDEFNEALISYLQNRTFINIGFWIGLIKGEWKWPKGVEMIYSSWDPDRPNGPEQNCAAADNRGLWNDVSCTALFYALCSIDNSTQEITTGSPLPTTTAENVTTVSYDYTESNRDFYFIIGGVALFVIIMFIAGLWQLKICCCRDKKESTKNDFFFEFDTKGSSSYSAEESDNTAENGHVNTGFTDEQTLTNENIHITEEDNNNKLDCDIHQEAKRKSTTEDSQHTFDLIADLEENR